MIDADLVAILRCPFSGDQLQIIPAPMVDQINQKIAAGLARDRADQLVTTAIDGGLTAPPRRWIYPIRDGIPSLIADEAIAAAVESRSPEHDGQGA